MKRKGFVPKILTRHPTHNPLRSVIGVNEPLGRFKTRSVIRLGSLTDLSDTITNGGNRIEINTIQSIKNSANKLLMKQCFTENNVKTADWFTINSIAGGYEIKVEKNVNLELSLFDLPYPIIAKHIYGSRGRGNYKLDTPQQLEEWLNGKNLNYYIFEKFYNYSREYRLHVTEEGCFYTNRKMLKSDTPEDKRWFRNDSNSNWWLESNEGFDKPVNWNSIVEESVKALKAVGLDFGAIDLKVQSATDSNGNLRENPEFIIIEINSAPSFGEGTLVKYLEVLPKLINNKISKIN